MTAPHPPRIARTRAEFAGHRVPGVPLAVVMTMGALHEGHATLVDRARETVGPTGQVAVTIFVNPRQFGAGEDFEAYPRTLEADLEVCGARGVDIVFAPDAREVYPAGEGPAAGIALDPGPLGAILEGRSRPGHFAGVLTVVAKLLHVTGPDVALFGEKDYQQLVLIKAMVAALDFPVEVVPVATVREPDGLALSSRNSYLGPHARTRAAAIPAALRAGLGAASGGASAVIQAVADRLAVDGLSADYVAVTDPELGLDPGPGPARLLVAVDVDGTRLIDNIPIVLGGAP